MAEGLDEARDAFAQEIPQASKPRDQAGKFVATTSRPEPLFAARDVEGEGDAGPDPRLLEKERKAADGRSEEGDDVPQPAKRPATARDKGDDDPNAEVEPERILEKADDAGEDGEKPDGGADAEGDAVEDTSPRYKIQVDGEEREVSLNEALKGYQREETFNSRMHQMVEVAKAIDQRGAEAQQAREAYIQLCANQEQEFAALIPKEPNWDELYRQNPAGAHQLESNYKAVYGTLNAIRARRQQAQAEAYRESAQRTASYAQAEFDKFRSRNKLANQTEIDRAIGDMRRTASSHGFSEDEIGTTYDERMLSILHKAAKYDKMVANKPFPVQPDRGALQPGTAPRVGNGAATRSRNDAMKRLESTGRMEDAAAVMHQFIYQPRR